MLSPASHKNRLPWDNAQLRPTDAIALLLALLILLLVMFVKLPPIIKPTIIPSNFDRIDRTILIPPPIVEAPKPKPVDVPKVDKKDETKPEDKAKPEPKPEPKPKEVYKPKLDEVKAIPKAAAPTKAEEVAHASPKAESEGKPASKEGSSGEKSPDNANKENSAAGKELAAAKERAVNAVRDTGLANALQGLDTLDPSAADSSGLTGKPTIGNLQVKANRRGGNGTGGGEGAGTGGSKGKGGTSFGSATGSDGTGHSGTGLGARNTKGVGSGSEIKDKGGDKAESAKSKPEAEGGKRTDVDRIMSQAKGRAQSAFKRALDEDPTLKGKVSVRIKISPSGEVTSAEIASSDLNNSALESKILAIVKGLNFASGNFDPFTGKYDFNFVGE